MLIGALKIKELAEDLEATLINEVSCELIGLKEVEKGESEGVIGDLFVFLLLHEVVEELFGLLLAVLVLMSPMIL